VPVRSPVPLRSTSTVTDGKNYALRFQFNLSSLDTHRTTAQCEINATLNFDERRVREIET